VLVLLVYINLILGAALGYNLATLFLGICLRVPGPPGCESPESETVKYGRESRVTLTLE
jgi:hypothetical protein